MGQLDDARVHGLEVLRTLGQVPPAVAWHAHQEADAPLTHRDRYNTCPLGVTSPVRSALYAKGHLRRLVVGHRFGQQLLDRVALGLQPAQPLGGADLRSVEPGPLLLEVRRAQPLPTPQVGHAHAGISLCLINPMICSSVPLHLRIALPLSCFLPAVLLRMVGARSPEDLWYGPCFSGSAKWHAATRMVDCSPGHPNHRCTVTLVAGCTSEVGRLERNYAYYGSCVMSNATDPVTVNIKPATSISQTA